MHQILLSRQFRAEEPGGKACPHQGTLPSCSVIRLELTHQVFQLVIRPSDLGLGHLYNCVSYSLSWISLLISICIQISCLNSDFIAPRINKPTANEMWRIMCDKQVFQWVGGQAVWTGGSRVPFNRSKGNDILIRWQMPALGNYSLPQVLLRLLELWGVVCI